MSHSDSSPTEFHAPSVEELQGLFPQLEIIELIACGGMGAVYKARQPQLDRLVALKILPPSVGQDPAYAERFRREARAMAQLNHPYVVGIFDFGQVGAYFFFVMEYVDGLTLHELIRSEEMETKKMLNLFLQICAGLGYAHEKGVVHLDIKPGNIMLDKEGHAKILDFGLASLRMGGEEETAKEDLGTPDYAAPERYGNGGKVDHRADIYSLGIVLYEMLTGVIPRGEFALASTQCNMAPAIDQVIETCLKADPEERYLGAGELSDALSTACRASRRQQRAGHKAGTRRVDLATEKRKEAAVSKWRLRLGVGLGFALFLGGGFFFLRDKVEVEFSSKQPESEIGAARDRETAASAGADSGGEKAVKTKSKVTEAREKTSKVTATPDEKSKEKRKEKTGDKKFGQVVEQEMKKIERLLPEQKSGGSEIISSSKVKEPSFSPAVRAADDHRIDEALLDVPVMHLEKDMELVGHAGAVHAVEVSPNAPFVATGGADATIKFWQSATGILLQTLPVPGGPVSSLSFSVDGRFLAAGGAVSPEITVWSMAERKVVRTVGSSVGRSIRDLAFLPDGRSVVALHAIGSEKKDTALRVWNLSTRKITSELDVHGRTLDSLAVVNGGAKIVASSLQAGGALCYGVNEGKILWERKDLRGAASVSKDGRFAHIGNQTVQVANGGNIHQEVRVQDKRSVVASGAGEADFYAVGLESGKIVLRDARNGGRIAVEKAHDDACLAISFYPDYSGILTGGKDGKVIVWKVLP